MSLPNQFDGTGQPCGDFLDNGITVGEGPTQIAMRQAGEIAAILFEIGRLSPIFSRSASTASGGSGTPPLSKTEAQPDRRVSGGEPRTRWSPPPRPG
ncbi:MAG: hypothetical protein R3D03_11120 [Geminicoccaceae bacterium]